jgi:prepilin-type N-terminal cleavage/methylation domain-containing protein
MDYLYKKINQDGFSLIELLIVVSIISFLASTFFPTLNEAQSKGEDARRIASLRTLQTMIADQTNLGATGYESIFTSGEAYDRVQKLLTDTKLTLDDVTLRADDESYAIVFPLKRGGYWCVDAIGVSQYVNATITVPSGPYSCALAIDLNSGPGSIDTEFTQGFIVGGVSKGLIQSDDKIILIGPTEYNEIATPGILRLNADGTLDTEFVNNLVNFINNNPGFTPSYVAINPENSKLYISFDDGNAEEYAEFTQAFSMTGRADAVILSEYAVDMDFTSDGTLVIACREGGVCLLSPEDGQIVDRYNEFGGYSESSPGYVSQVLVGGGDAVYAGGNFETYQEFTVNNFVKMDDRGNYVPSEYDDGFGFDLNLITDIAKQDESIYVIGYFTTFRSNPAYSYVVIDDSTNSFDVDKNGGNENPPSAGFNSGAVNSIPTDIAFQDGNSILVGNLYSFNSVALGHIIAISPTGGLEFDFELNPSAPGKGFNGNTRVVLTQSNGDLIVAGSFNTYNGLSVGNVVRLNKQ